jgi:predicted deacylase
MHDAVTVGPLSASPGAIAEGWLHIGELADGVTPVRVPVTIINGRDPGPLVYLHAGSHGQETIHAVETLRRLRDGIAPAALKGAIVVVPLANLLAHQFATRVPPHYAAREGVAFAGDLHKLWPGDAKGSLTQRIAHALWSGIASRCNAAIDLHAVSDPGMAFAFMYRGGKVDALGSPVWEKSLAMAKAFGLTLVTTAPNPLTLAGACIDAGKPAFMVEMTRARMLDDTVVEGTLLGIRNVLAHLGMIEDAVRPQRDFLVLPGVHPALPTIRAERGGFIRYEVECGTFVPRGTVIARVRDVTGREVEAIAMPADGYVMTFPPLSWVGNAAVVTGDLVADIFAPSESGASRRAV